MNFLKVERAKKNLSQNALADKAGLNRSRIVRAENVDNILKDMAYYDIRQIAYGLDMTVDEFVMKYESVGEREYEKQ
ncbi:helix-turn-helix domain-containing protein [Staphylococcus epidermidis]|uniref:helix-turn-helix domain-containing protein n=1 Tax=Staphylococcus epidermidis TaxID=1282 RepID=UPI0011A0A523|nr:helix-turn-helix transcriptional regulator [Staphylococcus epidermidis]